MRSQIRRLHKFVSLAPADRRLLAEAALWVAFVRLGLWLMPFQNLRRWLARRADRSASSVYPPKLDSERITWAVQAASRIVPRATCLSQALAAQILLQRQGYPADLRIGVSLEKSNLHAHAWVESEGKVVIGGSSLEHFTSLPSFDRLAI